MTASQLIAIFPRDRGQSLRVSLDTSGRYQKVFIELWTTDLGTEAAHPVPRKCTPVMPEEIDRLIGALREAQMSMSKKQP